MSDAPKYVDKTPIELDVHPLKFWIDDVEQEGREGDTFDLACCDCGLTHNVAVIRDTATGHIKVCMSRNNRSTAQYRRYGNSRLQRGKDSKWRLSEK